MKAVVFSGTSDGRRFARALAALGAEVTVCVATKIGAEEQEEDGGIRVHEGRLTAAEMAELLRGAAICADATHPYAEEATRNIRAACKTAGVEYHRLLRAESVLPKDSIVLNTAQQAAEYLRDKPGNVLLTTGAKELPAFQSLPPERLYPRVLPTMDGIGACEALHVPHRNIIAMQGPFSEKLNAALIEQFDIRFLVTKDGGAAGGFPEKAQACAQCGTKLLVLRRPKEAGETADEILERCKELL